MGRQMKLNWEGRWDFDLLGHGVVLSFLVASM
jgi:hypothetical protein